MQPEAMPLRAHLRRWNESLSLCPGQHSILASVIFHYGRLNEKKKKKRGGSSDEVAAATADCRY